MRKLILSISIATSILGFNNAQASQDYIDQVFNADQTSAPIRLTLAQAQPLIKEPFKHQSPSGFVYEGRVRNIPQSLLDGLAQLIAAGHGTEDCEVKVLGVMKGTRFKSFMQLRHKDGKMKKPGLQTQELSITSKRSQLEISMPSQPQLGTVRTLLEIRQSRGLHPLNAAPGAQLPKSPSAPAALEASIKSLKAHLSPEQIKAIPANIKLDVLADLYESWLMAKDNGKESNYQAFKMTKETAALFYYANWVLKNVNPNRVVFQISPKNAPLDFDADQYLANYKHVGDEAKLELVDPKVYAAAHYLHYKPHIPTLTYKK